MSKERPKQTIKINIKVEAIIFPIPLFRSGLFVSSFISCAHLVPKRAFEYQAAPNIKQAIAATKIAHQLRCEKIAVFMLVSFGLNVKAINNKRIFKNCFYKQKSPADSGAFNSYKFKLQLFNFYISKPNIAVMILQTYLTLFKSTKAWPLFKFTCGDHFIPFIIPHSCRNHILSI